MSNSSQINTDTWRLPPKKHSVPEASFTDEMYQKVGLPTAPASVAGGAGRPVVDTSDWKLPATSRSLEEDAALPVVGFQPIGQRRVHSTERATEGEKFSFLMKRARKQDVTLKRAPDDAMAEVVDEEDAKVVRSVVTGLADVIKRLKSKPDDGYAVVRSLKQVVREAVRERIGPYTALEGIMKFLDQLIRRTDGVIDPEQAKHTAGNLTWHLSNMKDEYRDAFAKGEHTESTMQQQRHLVGLSRDEHLTFATGTPHRRMPEPLTEADRERAGFGVSLERSYSLVSSKKVSVITPEMRRLAGMTEDVGLPRPLHDTRSLQAPRAHGILDDGQDEGEAYVERVLAESRWFFDDPRPFDEAPGGRRPPWQGSKDTPAETPIVRKGEVYGTVGTTTSPEAHGEVDVGRSEIDYDYDSDEEHEKQTDSHKGKKAPSEDDEEDEPGDDEDDESEDDEEVESVDEARDREGGAGSGLKAAGRGLKALGRRMAGGTAAQRAKTGLSTALHKFASKHGIDTDAFRSGKRSVQRELSGKAAKDAKKKQAAAKAGASAATKSSGGGKAKTSVKKPSFLKKTKAPPRPVPKAK